MEAVVCRLNSRKHRPKGSILQRGCSCKRMRSEQFCVLHRMKKQSKDKKAGEVLWEFPAHAALKNFRNTLKAIGEKNSESYGWKAFRAGKATQLASQDSSIGEILTAGEWRTKAFLNYIDEASIDSASLLEESMKSDDEEE